MKNKIKLKTNEEIAILRKGGKILADILAELVRMVKPGVTTGELDILAENLILAAGGVPSFNKKYKTLASDPDFPSTICACVNEEIVHAPASLTKILKSGDVLTIDIGMKYPAGKGEMYTDMATTVSVGNVNSFIKKMLEVGERSLELGIAAIKPNNYLGDISRAIQTEVEHNGFNVVRGLVGHGVGYEVHEAPQIPNYIGTADDRIRLMPGMVLALEPMVTAGSFEIEVLSDGWTIVTRDRKLSVHFEHTVAVTDNGHVVITLP